MSIFRRESEPPAEPGPAVRPARPAPRPPVQEKSAASESTHIAKGSKVVGRISGTADLVIDGVVDGEIDLESRVVIGSDGRVEGKILARSVEVGGRVLGNVQGLERVEVLATGSLEGDVLSPRVVISEGAFFKGKVEMTDKVPQRTAGTSVEARKPPQDKPPAPGGQSGRPLPGGSAGAARGNDKGTSDDAAPAAGSQRPDSKDRGEGRH